MAQEIVDEAFEKKRERGGKLPRFKTWIIHYTSIYAGFERRKNIEEGVIPPGPEFGLSQSLDGCYLDKPVKLPGITFIIPIDVKCDYPLFYLNPGPHKSPDRYILATHRHFHEAEVKYPYYLDLKNIKEVISVFIHVKEDDIDREAEDILQRTPPEFFERTKKEIEVSIRVSKNFLSFIRKTFRITHEIPVTNFRKLVRKLTPVVLEYVKKEEFRSVKDTKYIGKLIEITEPVSKLVALRYHIDYSDIVKQALEVAKK